MKKILTLFLILGAMSAKAQKHYFGVNGAVGVTNISNLNQLIGGNKLGFNSGLSF